MQHVPRAVTLIETLICIALFSVLMIGALVSAQAIAGSEGRNQVRAEIFQEGAFLETFIANSIQGSTILSPTHGESDAQLTLRTHDGIAVRIFEDEGELAQDEGGTASPLSSGARIKKLSFSHGGISDSSTEPEFITFEFIIQNRGIDSVEEKFERTLYLKAP